MTVSPFFLLAIPQICVVHLEAQEAVAAGGDCEHEGSKVCNGAVTEEKGKFVKICLNGKLKNKLVKKVPAGYPLVGRDTGPGKGEQFRVGGDFFRFCFVF